MLELMPFLRYQFHDSSSCFCYHDVAEWKIFLDREQGFGFVAPDDLIYSTVVFLF